MPDDRPPDVTRWLPDAAAGGRVLGYAIALSALVHSALAVIPLPSGNVLNASASSIATRLAAALVEARTESPELAAASASPIAIPAAALASPPDAGATAVPPATLVPRSEQPFARTANDTPRRPVRYGIRVDPMHESARLGELQDREMAEFPREVDRPAVIDGALRVQYPWRALAEGREDTVLIWAIIDASGAAEEIHRVEGSPEFYERVAAAVQAHRFHPAIDAGTPLRFPIALEVRFRIEGADAPQPDAVTAR